MRTMEDNLNFHVIRLKDGIRRRVLNFPEAGKNQQPH